MRYMSVGRLGRIFCVCALLTRVARSSAPSVVVVECLQVRGGGWTSMEQARCFVSQSPDRHAAHAHLITLKSAQGQLIDIK